MFSQVLCSNEGLRVRGTDSPTCSILTLAFSGSSCDWRPAEKKSATKTSCQQQITTLGVCPPNLRGVSVCARLLYFSSLPFLLNFLLQNPSRPVDRWQGPAANEVQLHCWQELFAPVSS
jgi:hypothetical protein